MQINDENNEVVEEYRTANIVGPYIGWMDNRNGNPDIYCDTTELPWVAITEISGGLGTTGSVKNIGTEDATGVPWELTIQGGILGLINTSKSGNADIAVGEVNAIRSGLFFGLGPIKITLTVDNVQRDPEGLQLIILTLI